MCEERKRDRRGRKRIRWKKKWKENIRFYITQIRNQEFIAKAS